MYRKLGILFGVLTATGAVCAGAAGAEPSRDEHLRRQVIGTWQDEYQGRRTKTLEEDGTGTMVVELDGMRARLFARRLTFEMVWSIENGRLKKRTVRGQPIVQVQMILRSMGDRVEERILELTDDRLLLLDQDGKTRYDWRRKPEEPGEMPGEDGCLEQEPDACGWYTNASIVAKIPKANLLSGNREVGPRVVGKLAAVEAGLGSMMR